MKTVIQNEIKKFRKKYGVNLWQEDRLTFTTCGEEVITDLTSSLERVEKAVREGKILCPRHHIPLRCLDCLVEYKRKSSSEKESTEKVVKRR
jgi:hypothetical protein